MVENVKDMHGVLNAHRKATDVMKLEDNVAYGHVSAGQEAARGEGEYDNV